MKFDDAGRVQYLAIRSRLGVRQANMSTNLKHRGRTGDTRTCTKTKRTKRNKQTNVPTNLNLWGHIEVTWTCNKTNKQIDMSIIWTLELIQRALVLVLYPLRSNSHCLWNLTQSTIKAVITYCIHSIPTFLDHLWNNEIYSLLIECPQLCAFQSYIASGIFFSPWSKLNDEVMFLFTIRFKINWGTIENVSIYYLSHIYFRRGSFPNRKVQKATIAQFLLKMESGYCETNYSNFTKLESNFKRNE